MRCGGGACRDRLEAKETAVVFADSFVPETKHTRECPALLALGKGLAAPRYYCS